MTLASISEAFIGCRPATAGKSLDGSFRRNRLFISRDAVGRVGAFVFRKSVLALAGWLLVAFTLPAAAATLLETSELLAASPEAAAQLPPSYEFTLTAAGNYSVTLRDLAAPAALQSLRAIVTRDLEVVAELEVTYPTTQGAPLVAATDTFAGTPGLYRVHVLGSIASGTAGGTFGISVAPAAGGGAVFEAADAIAANEGPGANQSVLQTTFSTTTAGTYQLVLADHQFPAALASTDVLLLRRTATTPTIVLTAAGSFNANSGDTYELIIIATADANLAGLYSVSVNGGAPATTAYRSDNAVGQLPPATPVTIASSGSYALTVTDLAFPEPLSAIAVGVTQNGAFIGSRSAAGSSTFTLAQGTAELFVLPTASSIGAAAVTLAQGALVSYADVHLADASADVTTPAIYSFVPSQPVTAGSYTLTTADFRFPSQMASIETAVVQGATVIHQTDDVGSETVALQAGAVRVLVAATPPPASGAMPGNGMFALTLATQPGNALVFESTQGVGGLFTSRAIDLPAAGRYDVSLQDFEFPERLRTSWLAITRGTTLVGQVIGSSTIQNLQLDAGTHVLNFLGQTAANSNYGAFGLKVADSAPPPVVSLTASSTTVTSGQGVTLQWSATNATSCTAAGGWTGTKSTSGTQAISALVANTTFELDCSGPSGRDDASVTVTVNAPSPRSSGGGGQFDPLMLVYMLGLLAIVTGRRETSRRTGFSATDNASRASRRLMR